MAVKKKNPNNAGRKLFDGKEENIVIAKLEQAFSYGATDSEACGFADISVDALYRYERKYPAFRKRKAILKDKPLLAAREAVVSSFQQRPEIAMRYLENKKADEFSRKEKREHTGEIEVDLTAGLKKKIGKYTAPKKKTK